MKLSRTSWFIVGLLVIALVYSVERLRFVIGSEKVTATFVKYIDESTPQEEIISPIVEYTRKSKYTGTDTVYQFRGKENTKYEAGEIVPVLLLNGDPETPKLYSFGSFWIFPLVYYVLPVLLWSAFAFSYIGKK